MKKQNDRVKVVALGGQDENGMSLYVVDINHDLFVLDCGFKFPEKDMFGVDIIIPDFSYLVERSTDVKAIIITHAHDDVMAGLPYLLELVNAPVYAPNMTGDLIEEMIQTYNKKRHRHLSIDLHRVHRNDDVYIANTLVSFYPLTHSIPGSVGVALRTSQGAIVYNGEGIVDFGAPSGFKSNFSRMMDIGKDGVLLLLQESSYAQKEGYTSPHHKLNNYIEPIFEDAKGRIIITTYAQNIFRIREIVELTKKYNRQLVFYGRDNNDPAYAFMRLSQRAVKPVFDLPKENLGNPSMIGDPRYDDHLVVLISGALKEIFHDICDIIAGGDERLTLTENDTWIVASPVVPGIEGIANQAINDLYRTDSHIHVFGRKEILSMHASIEDLKVFLQTFNPRYIIPIKGEYQHFVALRRLCLNMNMQDEQILVLDNGEQVTFDKGHLNDELHKIQTSNTIVDGLGVGDVETKVLDDRIALSNDGVVIIGATISKETREMVTAIDIQTRGFIYLRDGEALINDIYDITAEELNAIKNRLDVDINDVKHEIHERVRKMLERKANKRPVIMPVIIEV